MNLEGKDKARLQRAQEFEFGMSGEGRCRVCHAWRTRCTNCKLRQRRGPWQEDGGFERDPRL